MIIKGKVFNPGEMRTEVTLHKRTVSTETGGFLTPTLTKIADVWSKWVNAHGREVWEAAAVQAEQPATATIRYRSDVDETCVIEKNSKFFEIVSIDNIGERNEYMEIKVQRWRPG